MKTLSIVLLLMASMAFVMWGCSDNPTAVVSPADQAVSPLTLTPGLARGAVEHSVNGNGNTWIFGKMGVYTINARQFADGRVDGHLTLVTTAANPKDGKSHWEIVALTYYDNYTFSNGVSGRTVLVWGRELYYEPAIGKLLATFFVDDGVGPDGVVQDWAGANDGWYDTIVADMTPQDIASKYPEWFLPCSVGNVVVR